MTYITHDKTKVRQTTTREIKARCDRLWAELIKRPKVCYFAHSGIGGECVGDFDAAHIINRSQSARIMYHPKNGLCLCRYHHLVFDNKIDSTVYHQTRNYFGIKDAERFHELEELSRVKAPIKTFEWQEILNELKNA